MPMPNGYNETVVNDGSYERLKPGGHKCVIRNIATSTSQNGNKMLVLAIDTDDADKQPKFYMNRYTSDKKQNDNAKWKGVYRIVVDENATDRNGAKYGLANLKRLITAICDSADNSFTVDWTEYGVNDAGFCKQFVNRKVGFVFREEEYVAQDGKIRSSVKPQRPCNYTTALEQKAPEKKAAAPAVPSYVPAAGQSGAEGFMQYTADDLSDTELPFN